LTTRRRSTSRATSRATSHSTARSSSRSRSNARSRRRGGWPWWVRLVVGGALVAGVVFAVLWFNALQTWAKVAIVAGAVLLVAAWWLWTRRHEIRAEMERREGSGR
jgi:Flp pilus assembly protein TadB